MGSMLMRLAPLTTTGVGSLPFIRPGEAARHAVGAYELPFCPQLPHAFGDMVQEWLGADPGRCGWAPDRDRQLPAVWDDFILELERHPPSHALVKLQVTGPLTLAMALEDGVGLATLAVEISVWLAAAVSEQVRGLAELGLTALVMIDEPGLTAAHQAGATPAVWDALRAVAPVWGVHVCGEVPWRLVDAAEPDVISYDLGRFGCVPAAQSVIRRLMRRGGRIMWGAVDPAAFGPPSVAAARVRSRGPGRRRPPMADDGRVGCLPAVRRLRHRRRGAGGRARARRWSPCGGEAAAGRSDAGSAHPHRHARDDDHYRALCTFP